MENPNCQFVKLYKDETKENLWGWLHTYPTDSSRIVEQWAIASKADVTLYNCSFRSEMIQDNVPSNDAEWKSLIKSGSTFEAYIKRYAQMFMYSNFDINGNPTICNHSGNMVFGAYNGDFAGDKNELVQITLMSDAVVHKDGITYFKQITLMKVLEAEKPWLTISSKLELDSSISFGDFIHTGGINASKEFLFEKKDISFINFEMVQSQDRPPLQ